MMLPIKQSEATASLRRWYFVCVDDTDGKTPETGLTFTSGELQLSKAGGAFANFAGTATELSDGMYMYEATTTEVNTFGIIGFKVEKTGVRLANYAPAYVVAYNPYDSVRLGLTALPNAAAEAAGGLYTRGTGAGQINQPANGMVDVNAVRHLGTAYAAVTVGGVPKVDASHWNGTAVATPTTAGVPRVDVKFIEAAAITATSIASAALTAAKFATGAVDANSLAADAKTAITASVWAFSHISGRTAKGVLKRMDQLMTGKHTGMKGALWKLFDTDGVTELIRAVQDVVLGTRETATVVAGD